MARGTEVQHYYSGLLRAYIRLNGTEAAACDRLPRSEREFYELFAILAAPFGNR